MPLLGIKACPARQGGMLVPAVPERDPPSMGWPRGLLSTFAVAVLCICLWAAGRCGFHLTTRPGLCWPATSPHPLRQPAGTVRITNTTSRGLDPLQLFHSLLDITLCHVTCSPGCVSYREKAPRRLRTPTVSRRTTNHPQSSLAKPLNISTQYLFW